MRTHQTTAPGGPWNPTYEEQVENFYGTSGPGGRPRCGRMCYMTIEEELRPGDHVVDVFPGGKKMTFVVDRVRRVGARWETTCSPLRRKAPPEAP